MSGWVPPEDGMAGPLEVIDPRKTRRQLEVVLQRCVVCISQGASQAC